VTARHTPARKPHIILTHALCRPVFVRGRFYERLQVREPQPRDFNATRRIKSAGERGYALVARLCHVRPEVIYALSDADALAIGQFVCDLLPQGV
jgi:Phage tail assembly chaperone proteins, E, or 41 or 14